ncbi:MULTISPECIES: two-partner secretion domain-containing protein [Roseomonadaceae]|uniref:Filamentous hemagglutinin N-terminal domain-containing protein n=1 Tax=Falsiroseomonas oleicola TaxID=2801474 RepID=A0ABS6HBX6_9PROT|nr:filamentous hemagglutinin N-terminal domain-containing protein [Roseomonas oleicola]MBU8546214.1 filamentous hemagglutinin N-terminal domain-containing protein [Roseomonas oleicola]
MRRTSLLTAVFAMPGLTLPGFAAAQAPDARPQGGAVVAGQASISQTTGRTQVQQTTDRAVLEWQSFNVGTNHQVDIRQPAATSWSLNRVTGPDPSAIAGRVTSNGGVALVNPNGVLFHQGAQVDVGALIATTADTANRAFMDGRMTFDRPSPRPGARVENRGRITVADRGLAALVGPQVANSGTIQARLGRVALAGGEAFALDLAGDGLLSLDVTQQVRSAPNGATALVTQTGTIEAEGGSVLLTAAAVSGVLETLVQSGGSTSARQVALRAEGGGVRIDGALAAQAIEATASGTVQVAGTARLRAAPGGQVTIGAGAESRLGQPRRLAARTLVERGAEIEAPGGTVIIHAAERSEMRGTIRAEGGAIEVSSRGALALDGVMQAGEGGQVLVDPETLRIVASLSGATEPAEITADAIAAVTGSLTLQAERTIRVETAVNKPFGPLTLETTNATAAPGEGIQILRGLTVAGDLVLRSAGDITQSSTGALNVGTLEAHSSGGLVRLNQANNSIRAIAGGSAATRFDLTTRLAMTVDGALTAADITIDTLQTIGLFAPITASGTLDLIALRGVTQQPTGAGVSAGVLRLDSALGAVTLQGAGNRIAQLGDAFVPRGLSLLNGQGMQVVGGVNAGPLLLDIQGGDLTQAASSRIIAESLNLQVLDGSALLDAPLNGIAEINGRVGDRLHVASQGDLLIASALAAPEVTLNVAGAIAQDQGGRLTTLRLDLDATGPVTLTDPQNAITSLGTLRSDGALALATSGGLTVEGSVTAPSIRLTAGGALLAGAGSALVTDVLALQGGSLLVEGPGHSFTRLGAGGAAGDFRLAAPGSLRVEGALAVGGALVLEAASLALDATVGAGSATLRASAGDITQAAALTTGALLAEAPGGSVLLEGAGNRASQIGGQAGGQLLFAGSGDAVLDAAAGLSAAEVALRLAGSLTQDPAASAGLRTGLLTLDLGERAELRATANAIASLGSVTAPLGLALATDGALALTGPVTTGGEAWFATPLGLSQTGGGSLSAGLLTVQAGGGAIVLENAGNLLPRIAALTAGGEIRLVTGGAMALEAPITAGSPVSLLAVDSLTQAATGAGITAPLVQARSVFGNVSLWGTGNRLGAVGASGAAGDFALAQEGIFALALAGPVAAPSLAFRTESGLSDLGGGSLRGAALMLETNGPVRLDAVGRHSISAVGGQAGSLALAVEGPLQVTAALAAPGALTLSASNLDILAPVSAGTAQLEATAGDITQTLRGAGLSASLLSARALNGQVLLDGQGNQVAALGQGAAAGAFALAQEGSAPLRLTGDLTANTLYLRAGAGILDSPGITLSAGLLRMDTPGAVDFSNSHAVERLGGQVGALRLASAGALALEEALDVAGVLDLSATTLHLAAPLRAGTATLAAREGDITQAASGAGLQIGAAGLSLSAAGSVMLEGGGNNLPLLRAVSAAGTVGVLAESAMTLGGTASGSDVVLRAAGPLRLDGAVLEADRAVLLASPQGFTAGSASRLVARDAAQLPLLLLDSRANGLAAIPAGLQPDQPGLAPAQQATQLASFGPVQAAAGGSAVFDLNAGTAPVFLLLDGGSALGTLEAGRLGLLAQGGSAFILGVLGGVGGEAAAQLVSVPASGNSYQFNSCVMGSAFCSGAPPVQPELPVDPPVVTPPVVEPPVVEIPVEPPVVTPPVLVALGLALPAADAAPRLVEWDLRRGVPSLLLPQRREDEEEE